MSDEEITGLEAELRSNGISVETLERGDPVRLTYLTAFPGARVDHREIGRALNVFIDLAEDGRWSPTRVEATAVRSDDDVQGRWHAAPAWFDGLLDDELTQTEFSTRVLGTLEEDDGSDRGAGADGQEVDA